MLSNSAYFSLIALLLPLKLYFAVPCQAEESVTEPPKENPVTYVIYAPKVIRPVNDIAFTMSVITSPNPLSVSFVLRSDDGITQLVATDIMTAGLSKRIVLGSIPLGYTGSTTFNLTISGFDTINDEQVIFETTSFEYDSKALTILIQTDKAIYQPGQTIKFRALFFKPILLPPTGSASYKVEDPSGNIVLSKRDVPLTSGVADGELSLTKQATAGEWKIIFEHKGYIETLPVTVEAYKLPKFEVKITAPAFIDRDTEGFLISLASEYTFGQPVRGSAKLILDLKPLYGDSFVPNVVIKNIKSFDGSEDILITKDDIVKDLGWEGSSDQQITVTGFVTEATTSETLNASSLIQLKKSKIKVEVLLKPESIKPGLLYQALVQVTEQDGSLLLDADRNSNQLIVAATYQGSSLPTNEISYTFLIPPDGIVEVELEARSDQFSSVYFRAFTNSTSSIYGYENTWTAARAQSPSDSFIQITPINKAAREKIYAGDYIQTSIRHTEPISSYAITVIAKGEIIKTIGETNYVVPEENQNDETFQSWFLVTEDMAPSVILLASYIRDDTEVVADYISVNVELPIQPISIRAGKSETIADPTASGINKVDAGTNLLIEVDTPSDPGSYIGIYAVDQSVLLLKSGNDVTKERIQEDFRAYSRTKEHSSPVLYRYPYQSGAVDASQVFNEAGITVLSNALVYSHPQPIYYPYYKQNEAMLIANSVRPVADLSNAATIPSNSVKERSFFPETWIWDNATTDFHTATFSATVPDTITSWVINAFSVSNQRGLGIADTYKLSVFRNFFILLDLPLKITHGEIIVVHASVFNYLEQDLDVNLILRLDRYSNDEIELIRPNNSSEAGPTRMLRIPSGSSMSVKYPIRINALGVVPIKVQAVSPVAGDAVSRNVFVKPEGIEQCYASSIFIDEQHSGNPPLRSSLTINFPDEAVPGSGRATFHAYGNVLGSAMSNLGKLLTAPQGCGEQNMLSFAPDVFVALYLSHTSMLDAEMRSKATKHISDGYMNELNYKHDDGSFSAFGKLDASGSTWLTAFVAKCFMYALRFNHELIEQKVIFEAMEYLADQQNNDGSFNEPGRVIHSDMQGGVDSPLTITAYVLITFGESQFVGYYISEKFQLSLAKARTYLESRLDQVLLKPYELSLVTYALTLTSSSEAERAFVALNAHAIEENEFKHWHDETTSSSSYSSAWQPPYNPPSARDIEMTAYGLLTFTLYRDLSSAVPFLKWLVSNQNSLGGYSSTQDTVIAIQALSEVAFLLSTEVSTNLSIAVTHDENTDFQASFMIDDSNAFVYNTAEMPSENGVVRVTTTGTGVAIAQLSVCYNIPDSPYDEEPFDCSVNVVRVNNDLAVVEFCCTLPNTTAKPTGMFLFEIELLNGFSVDVVDEEERNKQARMVELDDDRVNIYYDQLNPGQETCAIIHLIRVSKVGGTKPATLSAFDYYKPGKRVTRQYNIDGLSESGACEICGSECAGCPSAILTQWSAWSPCIQFCSSETTSRTQDCYDESLMKKVDVIHCGLTSQPVESQTCPKQFSCPDVSDGLWYDLPATYRPPYSYGACRPTKRLSPRRVIPGSTLNGNGDYLYCTDKKLLDINRSTGFTISFLVNPAFYSKMTTFLSIGQTNESPVVLFEKTPWSDDEIRFIVSIGTERYVVDEIPLSAVPAGYWSHIVLTWNEAGAKVYVNGDEAGVTKHYTDGMYVEHEVPLQFYVGKVTETSNKGFLAGVVSSFNHWSSVLPGTEITGLSTFYDDAIKYIGLEPILSVRHLQSFAPLERQTCFKDPSPLSVVYASDPVCTDIRP